MKLRHYLLAATGLVVVIIVAGMIHTAHFASVISSTQAHTAAGPLQLPERPSRQQT